jgi:glycosyltransferase involved in cell wall biosynthesis
MSTPKVSVCIDVFNYAAFLPEAVDSVLRQDFTDFEVIVVDDCSTDRSFEIAQSYAAKDRRVIALRNEKNLGMVRNRNACLRPARGEYIKILHADDFLCTDDALTKMVAVLDSNRGISLVACSMQFVDPSSQKLNRWSWFENRKAVSGTSVITKCLREQRNLVGGPSATMFRRSKGARGFDEQFFHSADWEMWLHLLEQGAFCAINEPLVAYRRHANQQTEKDKLTLTQYQDQLGILDRYLDKPYIRFSKLRKNYLRHKAVADFAKRSKRLGLPDGDALLKKYGATKFKTSAPIFAIYRQFVQQQRFAERHVLRGIRENASRKELEKFTPGLNVAGFFKGEYGIGDASRAFYKAIHESALPAVFINIHSRDHRNLDKSFEHYSETNPHSINLMTFSFDYARRFYRDRGTRFFRGRYNIAIWYWELEKFPVRWHPAFDYYDEIWVTTNFCEKSIADVSPVPVVKIDYPFYQSHETPAPDRAAFGLPDDACIFLFNFDFHSVLRRKNPDGLIAAFKKAFDPAKDGALLVIKTINAERYPELAAQLKHSTFGLNVRWINEHLDGPRMKSLIASADCYVSLHRSEGLGLGMAQAMGYGKPVIATGYSGNMDFMTSDNSLPIRYTLTELDRDYGVYEKGNFWAEPDLDHAAELMRRVYLNQSEAGRIGAQAREDMKKVMNPDNARRQMLARLGEIDPRFKKLGTNENAWGFSTTGAR